MATSSRVYVWDFPTRIFHWGLVLLTAFSWWSAKGHHMDWHRYSGSAVCGMLLFRFFWGFFGSDTSRFGRFVRSPAAVWAYVDPRALRSQPKQPGHNPLGGWSVLAMLACMLTQAISGLLSVDVDGIESGPFSRFVSFDQGRLAAHVHGISFNILLGLIILHVAAILLWLGVRRRNLIGPMVTGWDTGAVGDEVKVSARWKSCLAIFLAGILTWWLMRGATF